ncbi:DEAD/DEAH box helicase [Corynebacterium sp. 335C]
MPSPDPFSAPVRDWFTAELGEPTAAQAGAWDAISRGEDALVVAPTGSGKTLAAFLWAIDSLVRAIGDGDAGGAVRVLYVSPLKALGADVERNLRAPLEGIAERAGLDRPVSVGVRSGDTPPAERARLARRPPDILITTPESLFLMLTSKAREGLRGVRAVIVDEVHAVAGSKRGSHLALSLERLDDLVAGPRPQRIGLSATVRPKERVADLLTGGRGAVIVDPPSEKRWDVRVEMPVESFSALGDGGAGPGGAPGGDDPAEDPVADPAREGVDRPGSVWPHVAERVYRETLAERASIVFVNSRRNAEKLTGRLNELWAAEHDPGLLSAVMRRPPAQLGLVDDIAGQAAPAFARAHHGSVSREGREEIEEALKSGRLRCVVATGTLELGIDMGDVDLVVQVESPPSAAAALQRIGRAGHRVGAVSRGIVHPLHPADLLECAVTVSRMLAGDIEELHVPEGPLDVLAQHTVAAAALEPLDVEAWWATVRRAMPWRRLARPVFDAVVDQVTGGFTTPDLADLRPPLERDGDVLRARKGAQRLAVTSGGTIPDRGLFGVFLAGGDDGARRVGELDEEMVHETRTGDVVTLGASSWRVTAITRDRVLVVPAPGLTGRLPFWNGDDAGRPPELAAAVGAALRDPAALEPVIGAAGVRELQGLVARQRAAAGPVPDERDLLVESFRDETGDWQVVLHSPHGRAVNAPWAIAAGERARRLHGVDARPVASDDGVVLRLPAMDPPPGPELFDVDPTVVPELVSTTALFAARFRECAARSLLLPRRRPGSRQPLWRQRLRAEQLLTAVRGIPGYPVLLETTREVLRDVHDLPALERVLESARLHGAVTPSPSPFAAALLFRYTGEFLYEGDVPAAERRAVALRLDPDLLAAVVGQVDLREVLDDGAVAAVVDSLRHRTDATRPRDAGEVLDALRELGPVPEEEARELAAAAGGVPEEAVRLDVGGRPHVAHPADADVADADPGAVLRRWARRRGPFTADEAAGALGWGRGAVAAALEHADVVRGRFRPGVEEPEWCDRDVLARLRAASRATALAEIEPVAAAAQARWWGGRFGPDAGAAAEDVVEALAGVALAADEWDLLAGEGRLDPLAADGDVLLRPDGRDLRIIPADLPDALPAPDPAAEPSPDDGGGRAAELLAVLRRGGSWTYRDLVAEVGICRDELLALARAGYACPESMQVARAMAGEEPKPAAVRSVRPGRRRSRARMPRPADVDGRWRAAPEPADDPVGDAEGLLARWGVACRPAAEADGLSWARLYPALRALEDAGHVIRGGFVAGCGPAQFAEPAVVDELRRAPAGEAVRVVPARGPANPWGALAPWPETPGGRPTRSAGARVVLAPGGECAAWLSPGGSSLLVVPGREADAVEGLRLLGAGPVRTVNGEDALRCAEREALVAAGMRAHPSGLAVRRR